MRIVAALVNPAGPAPEAETVTLLSTSPQQVDLAGLVDPGPRQAPDDAPRRAAGPRRLPPCPVAAPVQLGNHGGLITLLNPDGLKVHGVAYTQAQAAAEGWSIVF